VIDTHASPPERVPAAGPAAGIRGDDLRLGYPGNPVLAAATVRLAGGEVTALVGPNGCGKSTLLRALARLHRPEAGTVRLADGAQVWQLPPRQLARRVTLLAQSRPTPSGVRVRDVVGYGRHPYRGRWRTADPEGPRAVAWAMAVTGLTGMADRAVEALSGGELQRVWLATCLAQDTRVLLLDEPTTFLDLRYQVEILDLIRDLADLHQVAVGTVLHDLNQAAAVADQVVLLHDRQVLASGAPAEVLTEPLLTRAYQIRVAVATDPDTGQVRTRPMGRHTDRVRAAA
jgi:iron complex transport system ATP-binding protein